MAEFQTVIREALRMCKSHACEGCPLADQDCSWQFGSVKEAAQYEQIIMNWAEKNPLVYPTWNEWIKSLGAGNPNARIDENTAKRLGIKPIEKTKASNNADSPGGFRWD